MGVPINWIGCLVLASPPPSSNYVIQSTKIVISYICSEVTAVTGFTISPKLQIKCFLTILLLIFSGRTKNKKNITLIPQKRDFMRHNLECWYIQSLLLIISTDIVKFWYPFQRKLHCFLKLPIRKSKKSKKYKRNPCITSKDNNMCLNS